jgi:hypothetical protein
MIELKLPSTLVAKLSCLYAIEANGHQFQEHQRIIAGPDRFASFAKGHSTRVCMLIEALPYLRSHGSIEFLIEAGIGMNQYVTTQTRFSQQTFQTICKRLAQRLKRIKR